MTTSTARSVPGTARRSSSISRRAASAAGSLPICGNCNARPLPSGRSSRPRMRGRGLRKPFAGKPRPTDSAWATAVRQRFTRRRKPVGAEQTTDRLMDATCEGRRPGGRGVGARPRRCSSWQRWPAFALGRWRVTRQRCQPPQPTPQSRRRKRSNPSCSRPSSTIRKRLADSSSSPPQTRPRSIPRRQRPCKGTSRSSIGRSMRAARH